MPRIPDDARAKLNTGFAERLERVDPPFLDVLVQVRGGEAEGVANRLEELTDVSLNAQGIIADKYIAVTVPEASLSQVARIPGVTKIHQDQPVSIAAPGLPESLSDLSPQSLAGDASLPFLDYYPGARFASDALFQLASESDKYVGNVRISDVEVPGFNFSQLPPGNPLKLATTALDRALGGGLAGETIIPSVDVVSYMRNSNLTNGAIRNDTKVAIIDTGHTPIEPENGGRAPRLESFVPGEGRFDLMGHGSWCTNMVVGNASPGIWGTAAGLAPGSTYGHFKALNTFPAYGQTSWILAAMDAALEWGADVISASVGGEQQGDVDEDPYCQFIRDNCKENAGDEDGAIFVVAAGNSGPEGYTITSPGVAPKALTVGSLSLTDEGPSVFSARGPQGAFYENRQQEFEADRGSYGAEEFIKPDVVAPGGGRINQALANESDEVVFQGSFGWYDGMIDGLKDTKASMKGTSMACPAAAGLVKRLYDAGVVKTAAEVKQVVRDRATVGDYLDAAAGANDTMSGKNLSVGFGPLREALFAPRQEPQVPVDDEERVGRGVDDTRAPPDDEQNGGRNVGDGGGPPQQGGAEEEGDGMPGDDGGDTTDVPDADTPTRV